MERWGRGKDVREMEAPIGKYLQEIGKYFEVNWGEVKARS
jgi:hypothetical protein